MIGIKYNVGFIFGRFLIIYTSKKANNLVKKIKAIIKHPYFK